MSANGRTTTRWTVAIPKRPATALLLGMLHFYRAAISPWLPNACRFEPTCSRYALEAVERYGALRGGWLALRRVGRCNPFCADGYDPVP